MRQFTGLLLATLLATACDNAGPQQAAPETAEQADKVQVRQLTATLREGTNMAVAVADDGTVRVISLQGQLFLLPGEGAAIPLTDAYHDAREPALNAAASTVAFHGYRNGNWDLFQVALDGGAPQALTQDAFDDREVQFVEDDSAVIFSSDRGGSYDIWRLQLDNGVFTQLSQTPTDAHSPAWHAGAGLAYALSTGGRGQIIVGDATVAEHAGTLAGLAWSPDGQHLSYQVHSGSTTQMRVLNLASGADQPVSAAGADVFPMRASWMGNEELAYTANGQVMRTKLSNAGEMAPWPFAVELTLERHDYPRKQRDYSEETVRQALGLAYLTVDNSGQNIYFAALGDLWHWRPRQSHLLRLTDSPAADFGLALHPDGNRLAYVSDLGGGLGLHVLDLQTGATEQLPVRAQQISTPSWSPDGANLAFFVDVPGNPLGGQLQVLDMATMTMTPVLRPMPAQPISWSGDGERVAITRLNPYSRRYREGMFELVIADRESGQTKVVAPLPHQSISHAVLMPDNAMTYLQGGVMRRLELTPEGEVLEQSVQITDEYTDMPAWSADGEHLVYLHGDQLKLWSRATGSAETITPDLPWQMAAPTQRYVLRAGRVFTGHADAEYLTDQDIVVEGSRIVAMGPADLSITPDIDASAHTVIPGMFEMHAHMGEPSEVQGRVWLANGITSVRDPGSNPYVAKGRQEAWDSGRSLGPRTHITGFLTDGNRVYYAMAEGIVSEEHLDMALARSAALELDFIKTYVRLPDHWQKKVVNFAHDIGIPVSSHELYPAVAHGMDHVEHIGGTSRRGYQPKVSRLGYSYQDVVELLSVGGMGITATAVLPGFSVIVAEEPDWFETQQFQHFYGPAVRRGYEMMVPRFGPTAGATAKAHGEFLQELTDKGALLVTGTDSPFVPYGSGLHAEFRLYARAGVTPRQILHQATLRSALAADVADELGSLEVGKLADMVVVDGDPLAEIRDADNVVMTIKHGFVYELPELLADRSDMPPLHLFAAQCNHPHHNHGF